MVVVTGKWSLLVLVGDAMICAESPNTRFLAARGGPETRPRRVSSGVERCEIRSAQRKNREFNDAESQRSRSWPILTGQGRRGLRCGHVNQ